jgi:Cu+-exporting ATPase
MRNLLIALAASLCFACGAASPTPESPAGGAAATTPAAGVKAPGEAKVGDKSRCPVSGEEFVVAADSPKVDLNGKTYYFCCKGCDKKFQADPQKYLNKT